jgi:PAS domain S-box-containing protein
MATSNPLNEQLQRLLTRLEQLQETDLNVPPELLHTLRQAVVELATTTVKLRATRQQLHQRNRELAEACQLTESERRRYHELFTFAPDAYLVTDPHGVIHEANLAAENLLQRDADELRGVSLALCITPHDRPVFESCLQRARTTGGVIDNELTLVPADDRLLPVSVRVASVHDEAGIVSALRWLLRDITDRRLAQQQIVDYQAQLRSLASDLTLTEQRERRRLSTELHDYMAQLLVVSRMKVVELDHIVRSPRAVRILGELNSVLKEALQYTRTLIAELSPSILYDSGLSAAINWLAGQMQRHDLAVNVDNELDTIAIADEVAIILFEAIRELLLNVVQHAQTTSALVSVREEDGRLTVVVEDHGLGFDLAQLNDSPSKSDRFGIFSVRERIEAIGGTLEIASQPHQGTRAMLTVPMVAIPDDPIEPADLTTGTIDCVTPSIDPVHASAAASTDIATRSTRRSGPLRILLVDDHQLVRDGLRRVIESHNELKVIGEASDGRQAVEMTHELQPDVVVMDINMPRMNGIEATRQISRRFPAIRIVGLSVHDDPQVAMTMRRAGAAAFLCKTEASQQLCDAIRQADLSRV